MFDFRIYFGSEYGDIFLCSYTDYRDFDYAIIKRDYYCSDIPFALQIRIVNELPNGKLETGRWTDVSYHWKGENVPFSFFNFCEDTPRRPLSYLSK
ncbi:hypothetical protein [Dipodfec virus UOA04_Rod_985]|nr:hypothetical protein [Dipodfec virus UOA04_Rod_985]